MVANVYHQTMLLVQHVLYTLEHLLLKALAELWGPAVVLGLGGKLPLLVAQMRANDVDLHKGPEALRLPLELVGSHHCVMETLQLKKKYEGRGREERTSPAAHSAGLPFTLILCSPLGCGRMSTHMTTSPTASTPDAVQQNMAVGCLTVFCQLSGSICLWRTTTWTTLFDLLKAQWSSKGACPP